MRAATNQCLSERLNRIDLKMRMLVPVLLTLLCTICVRSAYSLNKVPPVDPCKDCLDPIVNVPEGNDTCASYMVKSYENIEHKLTLVQKACMDMSTRYLGGLVRSVNRLKYSLEKQVLNTKRSVKSCCPKHVCLHNYEQDCYRPTFPAPPGPCAFQFLTPPTVIPLGFFPWPCRRPQGRYHLLANGVTGNQCFKLCTKKPDCAVASYASHGTCIYQTAKENCIVPFYLSETYYTISREMCDVMTYPYGHSNNDITQSLTQNVNIKTEYVFLNGFELGKSLNTTRETEDLEPTEEPMGTSPPFIGILERQ